MRFVPISRSLPFSAGSNRKKNRIGRNTNTLSRIRFFLLRNDKGQSHLFNNIAGCMCAHAGKEEDKTLEHKEFASAVS